jgi:heme exporter protein B
MLNHFFLIIHQEIKTTLRAAHAWLTPLLFFVMIVVCFPFAVGPDNNLLTTIAPGIIWVAVLLAIVLSIGNIFRSDAEEGYLDLLLMSPHPLILLVLCKVISHWVVTCLPLILLSPVLGLILHLNLHTECVLIITLLLGTPVLSLIGGIGAALVVGIRNSGLLLPVLILPLYIPVLIFGTGTVMAASNNLAINGYVAIMGALILVSLAFAPWMMSLALRVGVNQ